MNLIKAAGVLLFVWSATATPTDEEILAIHGVAKMAGVNHTAITPTDEDIRHAIHRVAKMAGINHTATMPIDEEIRQEIHRVAKMAGINHTAEIWKRDEIKALEEEYKTVSAELTEAKDSVPKDEKIITALEDRIEDIAYELDMLSGDRSDLHRQPAPASIGRRTHR